MTDPIFLDRPDHPDFWEISEAITELDDLAEVEGFEAAIDKAIGVNLRVLIYMGQQRALRAVQLLKGAQDRPLSENDRLTILWMDSFTAGYLMAQKRAERANQLTVTLDPSVNGAHRQGGL